MSDFFTANPKFRAAASINEDPSNFEWSDAARSRWMLADPIWQEFAQKWRNIGDEIFHPDSRVLDLTAFPLDEDCRLLIRDCYVEAEKVVWKWAVNWPKTGVILTGQPGIGKTFFIRYLLVRLLRMKQVVLLHSSDNPLLFYHDAVYTSTMPSAASVSTIPRRPKESRSFVWSLFDVPSESEPPMLATTLEWCFPVQAPSPSNVRYHGWRKERIPLFTGFPLWTHEELARGAQLSSHFPAFWECLDKVTKRQEDSNQEDDKTAMFHGAISLLRERCGDSIPQSTDEAFSILLEVLISLFGPIPRDVFRAMYFFAISKSLHGSRLTNSLQELKAIAREITARDQFPDLSISHHVISVNLVSKIGNPEAHWQIDFKSAHIGKYISDRLFNESRNEVRSLIEHLSSTPNGNGLAGSLFEPFVHRDITRGTASANPGSWSFRKMRLERADGSKSPSFVLCDSGAIIGGFSNTPRKQISFDYKNLPDRLTNDEYYIPDTPILPLIDSFVVDLNYVDRSADLWLLQITTSLVHKGSANGYLAIRKIIEKIRGMLTEEHKSDKPRPEKKLKWQQGVPSVRVHYIRVHPASQVEPGVRWTLPKGWDDGVTQADHRGGGGLLEFPMQPE